MSSVIVKKTRCPKCGLIKEHLLMRMDFKGQELTKCRCGYVYDNAANVYTKKETKEIEDFPTEALVAELIRRRGYA